MSAASSRPLGPRRALHRLLLALLAGGLALAVSWMFAPRYPILIGWNAAGVVLLLLSWASIAGADADRTKQRAGSDDPGRTLVYVIVVLASVISLFAAFVLSRRAHALAPQDAHELTWLCLSSVALAWALTHTAFTFRYAHVYYRDDDDGIGGVEFPGGQPPTYFDFAYFSFTIGMTFQVSDATISSSQIRRSVLLQALIAFVYNTVILAFVLNLVFGSLG